MGVPSLNELNDGVVCEETLEHVYTRMEPELIEAELSLALSYSETLRASLSTLGDVLTEQKENELNDALSTIVNGLSKVKPHLRRDRE